jgi:hypothetical protein
MTSDMPFAQPSTLSGRRAYLGFSLLLLALALDGCSLFGNDVEAEVKAARRFDSFPLYWLGDRFEGWKLEAIEGIDGANPAQFITIIYGNCTPEGEDEPSCVPPLQLQISPLCAHLTEVAQASIWKRRQVRGAPVGTIDSAPVLFTSAAQVKVYRGEGSDPGLPMRALRALRSINDVEPVIGPSGRIPIEATRDRDWREVLPRGAEYLRFDYERKDELVARLVQ